jgi:predicted nucleic acid-binding protein
MGNAIVTKVRRGLADAAVAERTSRELGSTAFTVIPLPDLLQNAIDLALDFGVSVYDALYVALALREGCELVTVDRRLRDAVDKALPERVLLLEEMA